MPAMPSPTRQSAVPAPLKMAYGNKASSTPYAHGSPSSPETSPPPRLAVHTTPASTNGTAPLLALQPPSPRTPPASHRPSTPPKPFVELWTPDSPSAAHPGLPPPPALAYDPPLTRARTRSNEDAGSVYSASPFADTNSLYSSDGGYSPPRKQQEASRSRLALVLGPGSGAGALSRVEHYRGSLETGVPARGQGRRCIGRTWQRGGEEGQKMKLGAWACALGVVLFFLVTLGVGVGIGVIRGTAKGGVDPWRTPGLPFMTFFVPLMTRGRAGFLWDKAGWGSGSDRRQWSTTKYWLSS
ncbi:predicted protein [Verticillium alfalfae VaMs.102]|uniref:Predicted protein n=1 Tax=Verticillium alfalfae (strain VaMs.102 / ATCC MYA-4576 / FGSC 10136) TaxID=526221 RepID=C9SB37_VERA1|nr:predicted protein [Verticillium alfalfae VaMs.102]EEY15587.1 predicted protein [Verticillium alfalfae VaMs.102]